MCNCSDLLSQYKEQFPNLFSTDPEKPPPIKTSTGQKKLTAVSAVQLLLHYWQQNLFLKGCYICKWAYIVRKHERFFLSISYSFEDSGTVLGTSTFLFFNPQLLATMFRRIVGGKQWYTDYTMRCLTGKSEFDSLQRQGLILSTTASRSALEHTQPRTH